MTAVRVLQVREDEVLNKGSGGQERDLWVHLDVEHEGKEEVR